MRKTNQGGASKNIDAFAALADEVLAQMVIQGQNKNGAMAAIISRYGRDVHHICKSILPRSMWVKDAEENTWLGVLENFAANKYEERKHFPEWIHTIACHCAFKIFNKEKFSAAKQRVWM